MERSFVGYFEQVPQPQRARALTKTELMILRLYSHGLTRQMVADERGVAYETIKSQTEYLRAKLAAKTTTHAVAIAMRAGLIP
jgi:DNA-binding NarL/FixJ family response regulator